MTIRFDIVKIIFHHHWRLIFCHVPICDGDMGVMHFQPSSANATIV